MHRNSLTDNCVYKVYLTIHDDIILSWFLYNVLSSLVLIHEDMDYHVLTYTKKFNRKLQTRDPIISGDFSWRASMLFNVSQIIVITEKLKAESTKLSV